MTTDAVVAPSRAALADADAADPLAAARAGFDLPDGVIYLDGNSLGPLTHAARERVQRAVTDDWRTGLIRSWNAAGWVDAPARIEAMLAPLLGADAAEVAVADSTSTNLFKALSAAVALRPGRRVVLTDECNFPTDRYVAEGLADLRGDLEVVAVPRDELEHALDDRVAVVTASHVDYRSGAVHDAARVTSAAHDVGALTVWDLSHSTGAVVVDLTDWRADFAVGCTYKFLNGGPGSPAYIFAATRHHEDMRTPLQGWFGHASPFDFDDAYAPAPGAARFRNGTAPILSLVALESALEVWSDLDREAAARKAHHLGEVFADLVEQRCAGLGVSILTPRSAGQRGAQMSLRHEHAYPVMQALIARGVIGDHRPPDILRFGLAPLYLRYVDLWDAVEVLREVLETRSWDAPEFHQRNPVV